MTHTPGPWRVGQALNESPTIEAESDKRLAVAIIGMHRSSPEARANAMLMAAAPDLLDALQRLEFAAQCRDNTTGDACRLIEVKSELAAAAAQARAAIAKAQGSQQ